jgi:hypothetical protein
MNGRTRAGSAWSREEIGRLRELAALGTPLRLISRILNRTESALRNKACLHGISLQGSGSKANSMQGAHSEADVGQQGSMSCARRHMGGIN